MDVLKCLEALLILGSAFVFVIGGTLLIGLLDGQGDGALEIQLRHIWEIARWRQNVVVLDDRILHEDDLQRLAEQDEMMAQHLQLSERDEYVSRN